MEGGTYSFFMFGSVDVTRVDLTIVRREAALSGMKKYREEWDTFTGTCTFDRHSRSSRLTLRETGERWLGVGEWGVFIGRTTMRHL